MSQYAIVKCILRRVCQLARSQVPLFVPAVATARQASAAELQTRGDFDVDLVLHGKRVHSNKKVLSLLLAAGVVASCKDSR